MHENPIKVGIIENDPRYLEKLSSFIKDKEQISLISTWSSAEQFWSDKQKNGLDVLLIDIMLGNGMSGIDLALVLNEKFPDIKKVIITNLLSDEKILKALKSGCLGYVLKSELKDLLETIEIVADGGAILTPMVALHVLKSLRDENAENGNNTLTDKERQIIELIAMGNNAPKAAGIMGITVSTARSHIKNIHKKLNVHNVQEMMMAARRIGIL